MWLVSRQWAGLLDGYRLAQGLDEQVQREWGERVADAGRQARQRVEAEHSQRMEEYRSALAGWEMRVVEQRAAQEEKRRTEDTAREKKRGTMRRNGTIFLTLVFPTVCCGCVVLPLVGSLDGLFTGELREAWLWASRIIWGVVMLGSLGLGGWLLARGASQLVGAHELLRKRAVAAEVEAGKPEPPSLERELSALPKPPIRSVVTRWKGALAWDSAEERWHNRGMWNGTSDGLEAEWSMARDLGRALGDGFIGIPGLLVDRRLDADLIVVGASGVWVLEAKYWTGLIRVRAGEWSRLRIGNRYGGGGVSVEEIPPFDRQWMRQRDAVHAVLAGGNGWPESDAGEPLVMGGVAFTHPRAKLNIDESCNVQVGTMWDWLRWIREAPARPGMDEDARMEIASALIGHGIALGEGGEQRATDAARDAYKAIIEGIALYLRAARAETAEGMSG